MTKAEHSFISCNLAPLPTIIIFVQALKRQPQLLLVLLQILDKLVEVQAPVFILVTR